MSPSADAPSLSVVVATKVGAPFVDDCIASVEREASGLPVEIIVVAAGSATEADRLRTKYPQYRVLWEGGEATVPQLRRRGVAEARGEIVAIIEEHCRAGTGWLKEARAAHLTGTYGAVGGPVADDRYRRVRDWVVYFCEYNGSLPPVEPGETGDLNGANIAYRREVLLSHDDLLGQGYWEASLHPALLRERIKLCSAPNMVVHHCGPFDYRYYLGQRFLFSRAFSGARAKSMSLAQRAAYLVLAPMLPALLYGRIARRVWSRRRLRERFVLATPLILPALVVFVAGEWVGFLCGPGDALLKVE